MKWMMAVGFAVAAAGCGYPQTKMVACPETGCNNRYQHQTASSATAPEHSPPAPMDADRPAERTPASEAMPNDGVLPDHAPPPMAPTPIP